MKITLVCKHLFQDFMTNLIQQWSQTYFTDLTPEKHQTNNNWFELMLSMLTPEGELYVPCLNKSFNKLGEEIND